MTSLSETYRAICEAFKVKVCPDVDRWCHSPSSTLTFDGSKMYIGQNQLCALAPLLLAVPSLVSLALPRMDLTDEFVLTLCKDCVSSHPSLTSLSLDGNTNLSLAAGQALLDVASENPNLRVISLDKTNVAATHLTRIALQLSENEINGAANPNMEHVPDVYGPSRAAQDEEWEWCSNHGDIADAEQSLRTLDVDTCPERVVAPLNVSVEDVLATLSVPWRDDTFRYEKFSALRLGACCSSGVFKNAKAPSQPLVPSGAARGVRYLVNALCILTQHPSTLQQIFLRAHVDIGLYELQLFLNGAWVRILIDDYVPKLTDIITCSEPSEMWASLIEKAFAKYYGGYEKLSLGSTATALIQLTGGCVHTMVFKTLAHKKSLLCDNALWGLLRGYMGSGYIVAFVSRAQRTAQQLSLAQMGFAANRCYTLLEMKDDNVVLHNPCPHEVPLPSDWIEFSLLVTLASKIYILRPHDAFRCTFASFSGTWFDQTAGGNHHEHHFLENPTYRITAPNKFTTVFVEVTIHLDRTREVTHEVAIYVVGKHRTPPAHSAHVATEVVVGPEQCQDVIVCTEKPHVPASYSVYFSSRHTFHVDPVRRGATEYSACGEWIEDVSAGGHPLRPTWALNPQYILRVEASGEVQIVLSVPTTELLISFMVMEASALVAKPPLRDSRVMKAMPKFRKRAMVTVVLTLAAGSYVVVPMTWKTSQAATFRLSAFTAVPATLMPIKSFHLRQ